MAISCSTPFLQTISNYKVLVNHTSRTSQLLCSKSGFVVPSTRSRFSCSVSMADGQSDDRAKLKLDDIMDKAKKYYDELPTPIKSFPWNKVLDNFIQQIVNVAVSVIKYLGVPMLAVSSLSEISYCAYQKKLLVVPVPLVLGFVVAGILKKTASKSLPVIQDADVPWHLIALVVFFTLLKLPGPYYPFWGRIYVPHFANGGLLRVFWMIYLWYQRPETGVGLNYSKVKRARNKQG